MKRRTILLGLGTAIAGGGAVLGTGAFTTVEADRSVSVNVAEDSAALVGIDVNDRYGDTTDNGVAEFDLQSNIFEDTGFNPQGKTILYGALAITNNSGESGTMSVEMAYESESVEVPDNQEVPQESYDDGEQFYFRRFSSDNAPDNDNIFEGLSYDGNQDDVADPGEIAQGETAVFDLVVAPGGELSPDADSAVDVTLVATLSDS
jgi:hypothetical protein